MGRTGHPVPILGAAALLVAAVGIGVVVTHRNVPVAKAPTTLAAVRGTLLVAPDGHSAAAKDGRGVPDGDVVETGPHGSAELVTRGRVVYLGPSAAVAVVNGAHQQLRTGFAVIDAQNGPGLQVDVASDTLAVKQGSAVAATRLVSVQIGALAGGTQITGPTSQRLALPALAQAVINGDALPATTTPLHLIDRSAEAKVVPNLVDDDVALDELAHGIDANGSAAARVIETAWHGTTAAVPKSAPRSDRVLPMVIADATSDAGGTAQDRYNHVVEWRRAGGSWGVIVALLKSHAAAVETAFDSLHSGQPGGQVGTVNIQALGAASVPAGHSGTKPGTGPSTRPTSSSNPPGASSGGHHGGTSGGKPTKPVTSKTPVGKVVKKVTGAVSGVLGLLPVTVLPTPKPQPSGGLLGGLLGH